MHTRFFGALLIVGLLLTATFAHPAAQAGYPSDALVCGTASLTTSAAAIASTTTIAEVIVQAAVANTVNINVGSSSSQPITLVPGQTFDIPVSNVSFVYAKTASSTGSLGYCYRQ